LFSFLNSFSSRLILLISGFLLGMGYNKYSR
jgi:hypothetical protein